VISDSDAAPMQNNKTLLLAAMLDTIADPSTPLAGSEFILHEFNAEFLEEDGVATDISLPYLLRDKKAGHVLLATLLKRPLPNPNCFHKATASLGTLVTNAEDNELDAEKIVDEIFDEGCFDRVFQILRESLPDAFLQVSLLGFLAIMLSRIDPNKKPRIAIPVYEHCVQAMERHRTSLEGFEFFCMALIGCGRPTTTGTGSGGVRVPSELILRATQCVFQGRAKFQDDAAAQTMSQHFLTSLLGGS
jgi:hypothetical protein